MSVFNSSPIICISITIGSNPAVIIDLKLDFWSILGHKTYFARGRSCLSVNIHRTRLIPVAMGDKKHPAMLFTPAIEKESLLDAHGDKRHGEENQTKKKTKNNKLQS